jgi:hypothetical protein
MVLVGLAQAASTVESGALATREEALALFEALDEGTRSSARLVRRYHQGVGWRFIVVVEGLAEPDARKLAASSAELSVIESVGAPTAVTLAPEPVVAVTPAEVTRPPRGERLPEADSLLRAAVKAHGGAEGAGHRLRAAESIRFTYDHSVPVTGGTLVAHNEFFRLGDALRLDIAIAQGEGRSSSTTLTESQKAYVSVDGTVTERDGARTLEMLERFSPEALLSIPLGLPEDVETAAAWRGLETVRREEHQGRSLWVVRGSVSPGEVGLREAAFDTEGRHLVWVAWQAESGLVTFSYADYRTLGEDLVVPFQTRIERDGTLVEEISIASLELDGVLEPRLFTGGGEE